MARFNKTAQTRRHSVPTAERGMGHRRDAKGELFLLAVSTLGGANAFYESAEERDKRLVGLVRKVAVSDPDWIAAFLSWLRNTANLRSVSLIGGLEAASALAAVGIPGGRSIVDSVLQRADEPGEALAYWFATHGRVMPKPVKRGIADAATRLYDEFALLKYDTAARGFRFGDVLELTHAKARTPEQGALFRHAIDRRHGRGEAIAESLTTLRARAELMAVPVKNRARVARDAERLKSAGMTWEALAGWKQSPMDADAWRSALPTMGYMARLRNLRNLDQAGVDDATAALVAEGLADPAKVARSKQLPMRFLAAHRAVGSLRWASSLEAALNHSLANVPFLRGRTLVLVDRSGSMFFSTSEATGLKFADLAAVFGAALALRAEKAELVEFGTTSRGVGYRRGDSVLTVVGRFHDLGGTNTEAAVKRWYRNHDRVIIVTDEQSAGGDPLASIPDTVPVYTWNLVGYRVGHGVPRGRRYTFGGLSDAAFGLIPLIEAGEDARWPF
ncbi:RNA-binding protein [Actinorhabdospora filicis]|uniref:RNA-binding protein n=1 Tax=Actinorhabdospora filicis TaxID=1785913 RepID=A0A9W6SS36_9ACTN|nr:TROVE domain-containing protein [Actinorhabdospora filicis]GLZ80949.1 RNA-binding protein [Actinorhabdospora filicis]